MKHESFGVSQKQSKKLANDGQLCNKTNPNYSPTNVAARASYLCRKCKAHGKSVQVKRHKKSCPFLRCPCRKCYLVDQGRKVVAKQIALYRDQKNAGHEESSGSVSNCSIPSRFRDINNLSSTAVVPQIKMEDHSSSPLVKPTNKFIPQLPTLTLGVPPATLHTDASAAAASNVVGPHCRRCRNHQITVTWKGHKKNCPYKSCPCGPCNLIIERKDTEKSLRDMLTHPENGQISPKVGSNPYSSLYPASLQSHFHSHPHHAPAPLLPSLTAPHTGMQNTVDRSSLSQRCFNGSYLTALGNASASATACIGAPSEPINSGLTSLSSYCNPIGNHNVSTPVSSSSTTKLHNLSGDSTSMFTNHTLQQIGESPLVTPVSYSTGELSTNELMPSLAFGNSVPSMYSSYSNSMWNLYQNPTGSHPTTDYRPAGLSSYCPYASYYPTESANPYLSLTGGSLTGYCH